MNGLRNIFKFRYVHLDKYGNHKWESDWQGNNVTDEGEAWILNVVFRNTDLTSFTGFELVLCSDASMTEADVFADITELTDTNGYTAKSVAQGTGGWTAPSGTTPTSITTPAAGTHDFVASGGDFNAAVTYAAITTAGMSTNRLIAYNALSSSRTVTDGDTLKVDFDLQASGS